MGENLLAVVIGGVIAIVGGAVGPLIQHFLSERTRDEEARRTNVRALILAVHELSDWMERDRGNQMFDKGHELGTSPLATIEALARVHFPQASLELATLSVATARCRLWTTERAKERLAGAPLDISGWTSMTEEFQLAQSNLIAAISGGQRISAEELSSVRAAAALPPNEVT